MPQARSSGIFRRIALRGPGSSAARSVIYAPEAQNDLFSLYDFIAEEAGEQRASGYIERVLAACNGLGEFPERGTPRDEIRPGLRVAGFERRIAIVFHIETSTVMIDRLLYGGRDLAAVARKV